MLNKRRLIDGRILLAFVMTAAIGCSRKETPSGNGEPTGTIRVSGAWALYPMMVKWGGEFQKIHPGVRVEISAGGAGKGVADALAGLVDIGMVSRDIRREEINQGAFFVPVVKDAVFPTANANNPEIQALLGKGVARRTFAALWMEDQPLTWGLITGTDLAEPVNPYTRSDACGAAETWAKYLGGAQENLKGTAVYGDPGLAEAVRKDPLGMGYNNLSFAYDAGTGLPLAGLRIIPIDVNENGRVDPLEDLDTKTKAVDAVVSGVYPSPPARDLYIMTRDRFQGLTLLFIRWILTDGQQYINETGYIRLQDTQLKDALEKTGE